VCKWSINVFREQIRIKKYVLKKCLIFSMTCVISCMRRVASPGSMHDAGCLGLVHWDGPEGGYGEGGGSRVQDGEHGYTCGGFISMLLQMALFYSFF